MKPAGNKDHDLFLLLVAFPIGILCVALMWSRHGFGYGLLTGLLYAIGVYCMFFMGKKDA